MPKNFQPYPSNKKAFTLVEILVVIGIITVLSALVITALNPAQLRKSARDTNRKKDISIISSALEQYYADNNSYPNVGNGTQTVQFNCLARILSGADNDCVNPLNPSTIYLKSVPKKQSGISTYVEYCYNSLAAQQGYVVCVPLEADSTTTSIGGNGTTTCTPSPPEGMLAGDAGLYCIENPF
jgi:prepilin-type N-terminal cleavage/methylation domain-containing protein